MSKKSLSVAMLLVVSLAVGSVWADLELYYSFDEGTGTTATDLSGNGRDGTLEGDPTWIDGAVGGALEFDGTGDYVNVTDYKGINAVDGVQQPFSVVNWFYTTETAGDREMVTWGSTGGQLRLTWRVHEGRLRTEHQSGNLRGNTYVNDGEWHHGALCVSEGANLRPAAVQMYVDGVEDTYFSGSDNTYNLTAGADVSIGRRADNGSRYWIGGIDDVAIYSHQLTPEEVKSIMEFTPLPFRTKASAPSPASGKTDLVYYADTLSWTGGDDAVKRDVYFGTSFDDVNAASVGDDRGVLVSEGLTDTSLAMPVDLELETTYYWRVDEVNSPPDSTLFKGDVWSFTTEPVALLVTGVSASASSQDDPNRGAIRTIDGSGLNAAGEHSDQMDDMWLNAMDEASGAQITYDLGQAYTLNTMRVWNHNSQTEAFLGYGIKEALVEISSDGETWTELMTVEIPQAPGNATYTGAAIALNEAVAQYVRIKPLSNYSLLGLTQVGLSEVQFHYVPVSPREFSPASGTDTADTSATLSWRAGRYSVEHRVLHSTDLAAIKDGSAVIATTADKSVNVDGLEYSQLNYWQVIDVTADGTEYPSDIMSFFTAQQKMIEDFEMYSNKEGERIYEYWVDGFDNPDENGAVVGNGDDPETNEVYEGTKSMPLAYNNTTAPKSEATRSFDPPLDLAAGNPEAIEVYVKGIPYEFNGYYSVDGNAWTSMSWNPQIAVMAEDTLIGMAVCSHDVALETTAVFTNVSTTGNVTGDWTQADIGGTHPNHQFTEVNGAFTIKAMGADIWTAADEFRFVSKNLNGVGSITAQVESLDPVNAWTKVGVMIRNSDDVGASFTAVEATGTNGVRYQARLEDGIAAVSDTGVLDGTQEIMNPPVWIRVERKLANDAAPITMTLTDASGNSATVETAADATTIASWTKLSAAPADLNVNLSRIESITIGVGGANVEGKIFVDAINVNRPASAAPPADVSDDALIAHYEFEGDTTDSAGDNDGELFDNASLTVDGTLALDILPDVNDVNVGGYMAIANLHYETTGLEEVSVCSWIKTERENDAIIVSFDRNEYYRLEINGDGGGPGQVGWDVMTDAGQVDYGSVVRVDDGEWHHIAGTFINGTLRIFIDAVPQPAATGGSTFGSGNRRFGYIGTGSESAEYNLEPRTPASYILGEVDDVRIYHRALLPGEITTLATP